MTLSNAAYTLDTDTQPRPIAHFCHSHDKPALKPLPYDWTALAYALGQHIETADKAACGGFILADFAKPYRKRENVTAYYGLVLDIEPQQHNGEWQLPPQPEDVGDRLEGCNLEGVIYTSHSHMVESDILKPKDPSQTAQGARYRVVVPLNRPITTDIEQTLKHHTLALAEKLALLNYLDPASYVVSQFFYMPAHRPNYPKYADKAAGQAWDIAQALTPLADLEALLPNKAKTAPKAQGNLVGLVDLRTESSSTSPSTAGGFDAVKQAAQHRWSAILPSLGITLPPNSKHAPCPACGGTDRFRFDDQDGHGTFICSQGGSGNLAGDGFALIKHAHHCDDAAALKMVRDLILPPHSRKGIYISGEKSSESSSPSSPSSQNSDDLAAALEKMESAFTAADGGEGDIGEFWEEEVLEAARYIYDTSKPAWARIRHRLKNMKGLKITDYDREVIPQSNGSEEKNAASAIIEMAAEQCSYIHDPDKEAYALLTVNNIRQCHRLESKAFTEWLSYQYYTSENAAPSDTSIKAAVAAMTGKAKFEGEQHEVFTRIAKHDGAYWLDLCNDKWQAIRITPQGWQVIDNPPVIFVRGASMRPLPMPIQGGGNLAALWHMANIPKTDRLMVVAWLLECLRPETPFVVLELSGEQGSAKSSTQSALRDLIDPNKSNLRTAPKQKDDVFISARNSHMVSFENLSHLSAEYQDALCSLATGAGHATRTLYSNTDETTMELKKPIVLNGIPVIVTAADLVDRTLHIDLPMLESVSTEADLAAYWETNHAAAFTGLLDAFSGALAYIDRVDLSGEKLPRMADFTILGEAVYMAHGQPPKAFLHDYRERRKESVNRTLESSPVAVAMIALLDRRPQGFVGTVKGLLQELEALTDEHSPHGWPKSAKGLGDAIQRLKPAFRQIDILLEKDNKPSRDGVRCTLKRM